MIDYAARHPELSPEKIAHYLDQREATRKDLKRSVGEGLLWRRQAYAAQLGILATDRAGGLQAYMGVANNASSRHTGWRGALEQQMKLHAPLEAYVRRRYLWLGNVVMGREVREAIARDPQTVNSIDVMFALAAGTRDPRQPVSAYTSSGEFRLNMELQSLGLTIAVGEDVTPVNAFGEDEADQIMLNHWRATSVQHVMDRIMNKAGGAAEAITRAQRQQGLES